MSVAFPSARGERLPWRVLPEAVSGAVEGQFGSAIASATSQPEGFSPAVAARLLLEDGTRLFLKAVGPSPNPEAPAIYRAEGLQPILGPRAAHVPSSLRVIT